MIAISASSRAHSSSTPAARAATQRGQTDLDHMRKTGVCFAARARRRRSVLRARAVLAAPARNGRESARWRRAPHGDLRACAGASLIGARATNRPSIQIAPRCALLPPVAMSMSALARRPTARAPRAARGRHRGPRRMSAMRGESRSAEPPAERSSASRSRSRCAPLPRRSTSAGFGVNVRFVD